MSEFIFNNQGELKAAHRANVPAGNKSKATLLDALYDGLRFPDYFGQNWDALEECIRDLSWLPDGDVILSHEDLPLSEDRASLFTYLSILKDAVKKWNATGKRKLVVIFPSDAENIVRSLFPDDEG